MFHSKKALIVLLILATCLPMASAVTIDGPTNFVSSHGGQVRYANAVVSAQISIANTITRFNALVVGGVNRGNLAFDCDTGSVMVITGVTGTTVQYTITAVGQVDSYVYFGANLYEPVGTNTDAVVYDALTGITTVTTTGNVAVTLTYTAAATPGGDISDNINDANILVSSLFALLVISLVVKYLQNGGDLSLGVLIATAVVLLVLSQIASIIAGMGY